MFVVAIRLSPAAITICELRTANCELANYFFTTTITEYIYLNIMLLIYS